MAFQIRPVAATASAENGSPAFKEEAQPKRGFHFSRSAWLAITGATAVPLAAAALAAYGPRKEVFQKLITLLWERRALWGHDELKNIIPSIHTERGMTRTVTQDDLAHLLFDKPTDDIPSLADALRSSSSDLSIRRSLPVGFHRLNISGRLTGDPERAGLIRCDILIEGVIHIKKENAVVRSMGLRIPLDLEGNAVPTIRCTVAEPKTDRLWRFVHSRAEMQTIDDRLAHAGKEPGAFGVGPHNDFFYRESDLGRLTEAAISTQNRLRAIYPEGSYALTYFNPHFFARWGDRLTNGLKRWGLLKEGRLPDLPDNLDRLMTGPCDPKQIASSPLTYALPLAQAEALKDGTAIVPELELKVTLYDGEIRGWLFEGGAKGGDQYGLIIKRLRKTSNTPNSLPDPCFA